MTYRNTFAEINLENIKYNIQTIIKDFKNYKYYIGVVKADCYGHNSNEVVKAIIDGGCNYLAVSSLDEALVIRKDFDIPILCLGIIDSKYINVCEENNIDVTVTNLKYVNEIKNHNINVHIKVDTGMNRLGVKDKDEFNLMYSTITNSNLHLQGIFTHIYNADNESDTMAQIDKFKHITSDINLSKIEMVHIAQSDTLLDYPKIDFCNGCRLGIIMYGFTNKNLELKDTISLCSEVIEIRKIKKVETVGYNALYKAEKDELIATVSIGYADGINRKLTGAYVYINDKEYQIVGNICMDMLMIKVDENVKIHDSVYIYKNREHIKYLSNYLGTIPYELICDISKRVPRKYI